MKTQKIEGIQTEGETHERVDHEDSDQYSSSESCTNIAISSTKNKSYNSEREATSSRVKRKSKFYSRRQSGFVVAEENKMEMDVQQKFQELSSVVPGLEMKDEDLMIDDAIDYLQQLEERNKILKEKYKNIWVQKTWMSGDYDIGQSSSSSVYQFKQGLPEVEAKTQGKSVLIRVHCENQQGYLAKVIEEIEKLPLNIDTISSLPFGDYFMDITVTAQVSSDELFMTMKDLKRVVSSDELFMTMNDLERVLREALQLFM